MISNSSPRKPSSERLLLLPINSKKFTSPTNSGTLQSKISDGNTNSIEKTESAKNKSSKILMEMDSIPSQLKSIKLPSFFFAPPLTSRTSRNHLKLNPEVHNYTEATPSTNYKSLSPETNKSNFLSASSKDIKDFLLSSPSIGMGIDENEEYNTPKKKGKTNQLKNILKPYSPRLKKIETTTQFKKTFHCNTERSYDKYYKLLLDSSETLADKKLVNFNSSHIQHFEEFKNVDRLKEVGYNDIRKNPITAMITSSYDKGLMPRNFRTLEKQEQNRNKFDIRYMTCVL